jgi:hypothetical protein
MRGVVSVPGIAASESSSVEVDAWGSNRLMLQDELLICWEQLGRWRCVELSVSQLQVSRCT